MKQLKKDGQSISRVRQKRQERRGRMETISLIRSTISISQNQQKKK